jgi:hypothetical protein
MSISFFVLSVADLFLWQAGKMDKFRRDGRTNSLIFSEKATVFLYDFSVFITKLGKYGKTDVTGITPLHPDHVIVKFTVDELLESGLLLVGYNERRLGRANHATNIERFKAHFGSIPKVCCDFSEDLQTTENARAWVPPSNRKVNHFLMAFHHLKCYPTEFERECIFDISLAYGRECGPVWYFFIEKIQQLKAEKNPFPDVSSVIFILTVDGTHCWIQEPKHPTWSQDSKFYSHKYAKAGINYELAISLTKSKLIWMNGPFKAF